MILRDIKFNPKYTLNNYNSKENYILYKELLVVLAVILLNHNLASIIFILSYNMVLGAKSHQMYVI